MPSGWQLRRVTLTSLLAAAGLRAAHAAATAAPAADTPAADVAAPSSANFKAGWNGLAALPPLAWRSYNAQREGPPSP